MRVLEASVTQLWPADVASALREDGIDLADDVVVKRLERLREWGAVHANQDDSRIRRSEDLLTRNWRYSPTDVGRKIQRFYMTSLAGTSAAREIPLKGLSQVVKALEALCDTKAADPATLIGTIFVNHDDLDSALVGAEDTLSGLAERFDLDDDDTSELRALLVGYATRVAAELDRGSVAVGELLERLRPRFPELASIAVQSSDARALIDRGVLSASRGGRVSDWEGLVEWFDPVSGRSARFSLRIVRALPGMHANLRRLHTSTGAATSRSRALRLARACLNEEWAAPITLAALGDHSWRKLASAADDDDLPGSTTWDGGPKVAVPELLRLTGRGGPRGRLPSARRDTRARKEMAEVRAQRAEARSAALTELLGIPSGQRLSEGAAAVALELIMSALSAGRLHRACRSNTQGVSCTVVESDRHGPVVVGPLWSLWLPGFAVAFHRPGDDGGNPAAAVSVRSVLRPIVTGVTR